MTSDETVVTSFVVEDEELRGTWTVTKASHGKGHLPPLGSGGEEVVAVTDERVLWFTNEREEVAIDALADVELEFIEHQAAPPMVLGAGFLAIVGVFGSIGAFFANAGGPLVVAMPALSGIALFLIAFVVARATGREGETRSGHRLRLWTADGAVAIWGEEATLLDLEEAITGETLLDEAEDEETTDDVADGAEADDERADDDVVDGAEADDERADDDVVDGAEADDERADDDVVDGDGPEEPGDSSSGGRTTDRAPE